MLTPPSSIEESSSTDIEDEGVRDLDLEDALVEAAKLMRFVRVRCFLVPESDRPRSWLWPFTLLAPTLDLVGVNGMPSPTSENGWWRLEGRFRLSSSVPT